MLWLWCRWAAVALIGPLAWEPPYAVGVALRSKEEKKKKPNKKKKKKKTNQQKTNKQMKRNDFSDTIPAIVMPKPQFIIT